MQQRRINTRRKIINATIFLATKASSLSLITVEDILKEAVVSRYTFYREFENVSDVITQATQMMLERNREFFQTMPRPIDPKVAYEYLTKFVIDNYDYFYMAALNNKSATLQEVYETLHDELFVRWRRMGLHDEEKLGWFYELTMSTAIGMIRNWMLHHFPSEKAKFLEMMDFRRQCLEVVFADLIAKEKAAAQPAARQAKPPRS
jgi:AcrR family transcriptional regulator